MKNITFDRYMNVSTSYHDSTPVGDLVNVMTIEINKAISGIMVPMSLIAYLTTLFTYIVLLALLSLEMTLLSVVVLLIASGIVNIWIKVSKNIGRKLVGANTTMSEFLVGRLQSPRLVRLSGTEAAEKKEFHQLTRVQRKYSVFGAILLAKTNVVMEPIVIGSSLILLYISYTALNLQIEIIGIYLVILLRLLPTVKGVLSMWQKVQSNLGSIEVIEDRLKTMQDFIELDTGQVLLYQLKKSINISNVYYRYQANEPDVLKNIKIKFKAGEMVALVGPSGSGKSTLIDLLPRLREPSKGVIKIDGIDVQSYTLKTLRNAMAYVPQSPQIFNGKVKDHILYGKVDASKEEVKEAAQLAGAKDFINQLPQGFDTVLGEDAVRLSGGQRQRLDLARALVSKSSILILDEPTSNLDAESEEKFNKALSRIRSNTDTTIIIVTHRLSSISGADKIIVLNQGKVESSGTHSELLSQNGWYAKVWKMQLS
jgi:ABC-type multidrug transport system fused ATPase/permease subunit